MNVSVGPKSRNHPFYGRGSPLGFSINGIVGQTLNLQKGASYTFNINTPGHPFYFTTSSVGGNGTEGTLMGTVAPMTVGTLIFTVPLNAPDQFYYQCATHPYMGTYVTASDGSNGSNSKQFYQEISPTISPVITGFVSPVAGVASPFDQNGLYIVDQIGTITHLDLSTRESRIFADLRSIMMPINPNYDERGLLGLAFSPTDPNIYFVFISLAGPSMIPGYRYDNAVLRINAKTGDAQIILRIPNRENIHNGGNLVFGPDRYLYIGVGDNGPQQDPEGHAQNLNDLHGKILRIDEFGRPPNTNPFIGRGRPEIYAYGVRNPWGISFDSQGRFFVSVCGYNTVEPVYIVSPGDNLGWNLKEGSMKTSFGPPIPQGTTIREPIYEYYHGEDCGQRSVQLGSCCVIGGYYVPRIGYIFGDFSGSLFISQPINGVWKRTSETSLTEYIKGFARDNNNNIYVLTSPNSGPSGKEGKVSRVIV